MDIKPFWALYGKDAPTLVEQGDLVNYVDEYGVSEYDEHGAEQFRPPTLSEMLDENLNIFVHDPSMDPDIQFGKGADPVVVKAFIDQYKPLNPGPGAGTPEASDEGDNDAILVALSNIPTTTEVEKMVSDGQETLSLEMKAMESRIMSRFDTLTTLLIGVKTMMTTQEKSVEAALKVASNPVKVSPRAAAGQTGAGGGSGKLVNSPSTGTAKSGQLAALRAEIASRPKPAGPEGKKPADE